MKSKIVNLPDSHTFIGPQPSLKKYFEILSCPIGTDVKVLKKNSKYVPNEIDSKFGKIYSFEYSRFVNVEIMNEDIYPIPFDNIEVISENKLNIFKKIWTFICIKYFCLGKIE
jgi:hypothetical protein